MNKKQLIVGWVVTVLLLGGCATTKPIYLDALSAYELHSRLNQIEAELQYLQYYPPQSQKVSGGGFWGGFIEGLAEGLPKIKIQRLLRQRAAILSELQRREY